MSKCFLMKKLKLEKSLPKLISETPWYRVYIKNRDECVLFRSPPGTSKFLSVPLIGAFYPRPEARQSLVPACQSFWIPASWQFCIHGLLPPPRAIIIKSSLSFSNTSSAARTDSSVFVPCTIESAKRTLNPKPDELKVLRMSLKPALPWL